MKIFGLTDRPVSGASDYGSTGIGDVARASEDYTVKESKVPEKVNSNLAKLLDGANVKYGDSTTRGFFQRLMNKLADRAQDLQHDQSNPDGTVPPSDLADPSEGYHVSPTVKLD